MGDMIFARRVRAVAAAALALTVYLALAGCGDDGSTSSTAAQEPAVSGTSSTPTRTPRPSKSADTSVQDALDEAGVSDALAQRLVVAADDAGYGPADTSFAALMIDTCRDVDSGYSNWNELIDQDVADGAPRRQAGTFYAFLRTQFCPAVKPAPDKPQPSGDADAAASGTRGLGTSADYLDAHWKHGDLATCRAATGAPLGEPRTYIVAPGALMCGDVGVGVYGNTFIDLDVVFTPPVPEAAARQVAEKLLPVDATFVERRMGKNPPYANRGGSCPSLLYRSQTLAAAVNAAADAGVDASGPEATATFYSDRQTNYGSSTVYDGRVRTLSLGIGGFNTGYQSNTPTC